MSNIFLPFITTQNQLFPLTPSDRVFQEIWFTIHLYICCQNNFVLIQMSLLHPALWHTPNYRLQRGTTCPIRPVSAAGGGVTSWRRWRHLMRKARSGNVLYVILYW